jgi:hypothetical protein
MNSNEILVNYKVAYVFEIYNFHFGSFIIQGRLQNLIFKFENFKHIFL